MPLGTFQSLNHSINKHLFNAYSVSDTPLDPISRAAGKADTGPVFLGLKARLISFINMAAVCGLSKSGAKLVTRLEVILKG